MADLAAIPTATTATAVEPEVAAGRRAFPQAQELLAGSPLGNTVLLQVGWHDTGLHEETGAFALVRDGAGLDDLIGEIVRVSYLDRHVFVYVLQAVPLPDVTPDVTLVRRAFMAIGRLSLEVVTAAVVVVE